MIRDVFVVDRTLRNAVTPRSLLLRGRVITQSHSPITQSDLFHVNLNLSTILQVNFRLHQIEKLRVYHDRNNEIHQTILPKRLGSLSVNNDALKGLLMMCDAEKNIHPDWGTKTG